MRIATGALLWRATRRIGAVLWVLSRVRPLIKPEFRDKNGRAARGERRPMVHVIDSRHLVTPQARLKRITIDDSARCKHGRVPQISVKCIPLS